MDKYASLNEMQQRAVYQTEGPVLILAGAGSGKTRVLTHRLSYLVEELMVPAYHILAITFTNKAAKEMKERVESKLGSLSDSIFIGTFHSFGLRILRENYRECNYSSNIDVYGSDMLNDNQNQNPKLEYGKAIIIDKRNTSRLRELHQAPTTCILR